MANQEQLEILKKGSDYWNKWRAQNKNVKIDLGGANLENSQLWGINFSEAYLRNTDLRNAYLSRANLSNADLRTARLNRADISVANLNKADLIRADLSESKLNDADLTCADLGDANLRNANLYKAKLFETDLRMAQLNEADIRACDLRGANLEFTQIGNTVFADIDLSETQGLEEVRHDQPSHISVNVLQRSKGNISEKFLRGCGLSDADIMYAKLYNPDLSNEEITKIQYSIYDLRAAQALQISPLFISYSHADSIFVDTLEKGLNAKGIRFWRDIHDMTAGRIETQIDRAIRQNPTVLLVLSKNSINSDWVQHEVRKARELEKELGRDALCPIALDDGWKSSRWPQRVMEQVMEYNILDFSKWDDESTFKAKFTKLLSGLDLFYKKP